MEKLYTAKQMAEKMGVHPATIKRWTREGKIQDFIKTPGGHYRYHSEDTIKKMGGYEKKGIIELKIPNKKRKKLEKKMREKIGKNITFEEGVLMAIEAWMKKEEK